MYHPHRVSTLLVWELHMRSFRITACLVLAAVLGYAQNIYSTLMGTVADSSGAAFTGAKGTLVEKAKGGVREFSTAADGSFSVPELAPGTYDISIKATGFKSLTVRDVVLTAGEIRSLGQ